MAIDQQTMYQIIKNVFGEMLSMPVEEHAMQEVDLNEPRVVARITISGDMIQDLVVHAPVDSAANIASVMFDTDAASLDESEINDAIGEVANMIAGSVKGSCQPEAKLSLPEAERVTGETQAVEQGAATVVLVSDLPLVVSCACVESAVSSQ